MYFLEVKLLDLGICKEKGKWSDGFETSPIAIYQVLISTEKQVNILTYKYKCSTFIFKHIPFLLLKINFINYI